MGKARYTVVIEWDPEEKLYIATIPALSVGSYGVSRKEAMEKIKEAAELTVEAPYGTMTDEAIAAMDIPSLLKSDAWLFLWTISRKMPMPYGLLDAWKLRYRFTMVWHKTAGVQLPQSPCYNGEFVLVGSVGTPKWRATKGFKTVFTGARRGHSTKPAEFYDMIRRVTDGERLDMFNRRAIAGFQGWGVESPMTAQTPDYWQEPMDVGADK